MVLEKSDVGGYKEIAIRVCSMVVCSMVVAVWYIWNPILNTSIQLLARGDALLIPTSEAQLPVHKMPPMDGDAAHTVANRRRLRIK